MNNNIFSRFFNRRPSNVTDDLPIESIRATSLYSLRTMKHYGSDDYENGYSSIRAIADRFLLLKPYATDENGKKVEVTPNAINCMSRPNQDMSGIDFRDALAVMTMVHEKVYVLVWQKTGINSDPVPAKKGIREDQIAGYTFLEGVVEQNVGYGLQYQVNVQTENGSEPRIFYPYQVAVLHDINPSALSRGYSPSRASKRWTRIDDYIADYQSGFFENGAVPAGQFIITAPTSKEYENIVDKLQEKHRGAGKNGNVVYSYQPIDPKTGAAGQPTITWVPFNTSNKDMSLEELFTQANKKIDSVYRVSAFIRAIDEAPNFATAQVIERNFVENTIRPFAIKKFGRFQHELNRITGGLGYGITFDLKTPSIAEEDKLTAETKLITITSINTLVTFGYTYESAVDALQLPPNWKLLKKGTDTSTTINNDKSDVDEGGEVIGAPDNQRGRKGTNPKVRNKITREDLDKYQLQLMEPPRSLMQKQVDRAVSEIEATDAYDATDEEKDVFVDEMMAIIATILLVGGINEWEQSKQMLLAAGITPQTTSYSLSDDAIARYRTYLYAVADSYSNDTTKAIRATLERSYADELSKGEIEKALRNIMNTDEWRVTRLARTETNRSSALSSIESMIKLEDEMEVTIEKSLESGSGSPCEFCMVYIGKWIPVKSVMVKKGQIVTGVDGGVMVNNWQENMGSDIHANGECYAIFRVV